MQQINIPVLMVLDSLILQIWQNQSCQHTHLMLKYSGCIPKGVSLGFAVAYEKAAELVVRAVRDPERLAGNINRDLE